MGKVYIWMSGLDWRLYPLGILGWLIIFGVFIYLPALNNKGVGIDNFLTPFFFWRVFDS